MATDTLYLMSSDHQVFQIESRVACRSETVKNMVGDCGTADSIPLPNVSSAVLSKVIEYFKYHDEAETNKTSVDDIAAWNKQFLEMEDEILFALIVGANYLDAKQLLDCTCKAVADEIKGKTPEEIRTRFNIVNDFTPEEEEEVKRENAWCEER